MNTPKGFHFQWVYEDDVEGTLTSSLHSDNPDLCLKQLLYLFKQFLKGCEYSEKKIDCLQYVDEEWS